jgi:DNA helicase-2/ATP-dependent DNA helicase PcrA
VDVQNKRSNFLGRSHSRTPAWRRASGSGNQEQPRKRSLEPEAPQPKSVGSGKFKRGERVKHAKFGEGTVIDVKIQNGEEEVTVAFPGKGVKRLLTSFAPLEKISA